MTVDEARDIMAGLEDWGSRLERIENAVQEAMNHGFVDDMGYNDDMLVGDLELAAAVLTLVVRFREFERPYGPWAAVCECEGCDILRALAGEADDDRG